MLRLLRGVPLDTYTDAFPRLLSDRVAGPVSREAISLLERLFSGPDSTGSRMAARAAAPMEPAETTAASCAALAGDLLGELRKG